MNKPNAGLEPGCIQLLDGLVLRTQVGAKAHDFDLTPEEAISLGRTLMLAGETYRRLQGGKPTMPGSPELN